MRTAYRAICLWLVLKVMLLDRPPSSRFHGRAVSSHTLTWTISKKIWTLALETFIGLLRHTIINHRSGSLNLIAKTDRHQVNAWRAEPRKRIADTKFF